MIYELPYQFLLSMKVLLLVRDLEKELFPSEESVISINSTCSINNGEQGGSLSCAMFL